MKENLASGSTLWRNKVTEFRWIKTPPTVRGKDSTSGPAPPAPLRGSNPRRSGCHHQSCSLSDAPVGKGVGHLFPGSGTSPRLCLRILGRVMLEHEPPGDVLSFKTRQRGASRDFLARVK